MAVETLSPDWEFDRVDDGSQSKRATRRGLRADAPALTSVLAAFLRKGSASRSLRSRRVPGTFCGLRGMRSRAFLSGLGISAMRVRLARSGLVIRGGDSPEEPGVPLGERRALSAALGHGRGGFREAQPPREESGPVFGLLGFSPNHQSVQF